MVLLGGKGEGGEGKASVNGRERWKTPDGRKFQRRGEEKEKEADGEVRRQHQSLFQMGAWQASGCCAGTETKNKT